MDKFIIHGGKKLYGSINVSGAKNSSLALMPACLLSSGISTLSNTPRLNDVFTMMKLLQHLGVTNNFENHILKLDTSKISSQDAPYEYVKKMRASVYVLGPLLTRFGYAKVSLPGGCAWGPRPINLHLEALKKMGAEIELSEGYIIAKAQGGRLKGTKINFDVPSVGATGNILMASALAKGVTQINNAATEPEIKNLTEFLIKMGAKIDGAGSNTLLIEGVDNIIPASIETIPDRIEAGTILISAAITRGQVELTNLNTTHLRSVLSKLEDCGCKVESMGEGVKLTANDFEINPVDVTTAVYPGFPTDMQAQWTALMCLANGTSKITDTIYLDRFKHIPELMRLGADIVVNENNALVKGVKKLFGAKVMSTDLRASASLVIAGLAAEGTTEVLRVYHLDRGYQRIEEKLTILHADIQRVEGTEF